MDTQPRIYVAYFIVLEYFVRTIYFKTVKEMKLTASKLNLITSQNKNNYKKLNCKRFKYCNI